MPGALPTVWCDLRGLAKDHQRGLIQPFIAAMQCVALALLAPTGEFSLWDLGRPRRHLARADRRDRAGHRPVRVRVDQTAFRRVMLAILFAGGMALVVYE